MTTNTRELKETFGDPAESLQPRWLYATELALGTLAIGSGVFALNAGELFVGTCVAYTGLIADYHGSRSLYRTFRNSGLQG